MSADVSSTSLSHQINLELSDEVMAKLNYLAKEKKTDLTELIHRLLETSFKE